MGRAIVIGASIGGCLAAAAAYQHMDEVIVLDQDQLPDGPVVRHGAAHGAQFHALLARGLQVMEQFFPGFEQDAVRHGCHPICVTQDIANRKRYGWATRLPSNVTNILASRPMIEHLLRARLAELPGVRIQDSTSVAGLTATPDRGRITGVSAAGQVLQADLVIDASGRGSRAPQWLESLGYDAPRETQVDARWGYTSCRARARSGAKFDFEALSALPLGIFATGTPRTRGVAMWRQEGPEDWIVTAIGSSGDHPPGDEAGFRSFIESLPHPEVHDALRSLELVLPARAWRRTVNRLRHYDDLRRMPEGFVLVGDAVAAFNPVYGQGMTVAAIEASELRDALAAHAAAGVDNMDGFGRRFQQRIASSVRYCWELSTGADYRIEGVIGAPPPSSAAARAAFMDRIEGLSSEDPEVLVALLETTQLLRGPEWLSAPETVARVERDWERLGRLVGASRDA